jgi:hypothetical protein
MVKAPALAAAMGQDTLEVKHFSNEEGKGWQRHILQLRQL